MMAISEKRFTDIVLELIDENPFAIRTVLKIADTVFTDTVPTLAVSCTERPTLSVNLNFLRKYCSSEPQVKAVICHEFLHVVLRHTEERVKYTLARHIAFDAVINAIIHRQFGKAYSSFMTSYYGTADDEQNILHPITHEKRERCEKAGMSAQFINAWQGLYDGKLIADDIMQVMESIGIDDKKAMIAIRLPGTALGTGASSSGETGEGDGPEIKTDDGAGGNGDADADAAGNGGSIKSIVILLGDHDSLDDPLPEPLKKAIDKTLQQMNGSGIWRSPRERGIGCTIYEALIAAGDTPKKAWMHKAYNVLKRHVSPDKTSRAMRDEAGEYRIPVLSQSDRRAFLRTMWTPFLPDASWDTMIPRRHATTQIYLDVSGSMNAELPLLISLLSRLSPYIRRPFWAFSDNVAPAVIEKGRLITNTSGGTSMRCVIEHVKKTKPEAAVIITDGYIENDISRTLAASVKPSRIHAIVVRDGSTRLIDKAGIACTQLEALP